MSTKSKPTKRKQRSGFGQRLHAARTAAGLDQRQLSKASRVSFPLIYKLEGPGGGNPTLSTIQNLARALGVPVAALVGE